MLRLGREHRTLRIVDDQVGCPTWAANLASATMASLDQGLLQGAGGCRLFHYSDGDVVSWFGFAALIFELGQELGLIDNAPELVPIDTDGYPQTATRPKYSVLNTGEFQAAAGFKPPRLRDSLRSCLEELKQ